MKVLDQFLYQHFDECMSYEMFSAPDPMTGFS